MQGAQQFFPCSVSLSMRHGTMTTGRKTSGFPYGFLTELRPGTHLKAARYSVSPMGGSRPPVKAMLTLKPTPGPVPTCGHKEEAYVGTRGTRPSGAQVYPGSPCAVTHGPGLLMAVTVFPWVAQAFVDPKPEGTRRPPVSPSGTPEDCHMVPWLCTDRATGLCLWVDRECV